MNESQQPSVWEKVCYGSGDLASNLMWATCGSYLLYYYTDILRLDLAAITFLLLVVRVIDAFVDPVVGYFLDKRSGATIPRIIRFLAIPFGLTAFLTFLPIAADPWLTLVWASVSYLAFGAVYAAINTSYGVLNNLMSQDAQVRVSLSVYRMVGCQVGVFFIASCTLPLVHWLGGANDVTGERTGFAPFAAILAAMATLLWLATGSVCKVRNFSQPTPYRLLDVPKLLMRNTAWRSCTAAFALYFVNISAYVSMAIFYAKVVLGRDAEFGGVMLSLFTFAAMFSMLFASRVTRRLGKRTTLQVSNTIQGMAMVGVLCAPHCVPVVLVMFSIASFTLGLGSPIYYAMVSDSIDLGTQQSGVRMAGMAYAINSLAMKLAYAATGSLVASFLTFGGYDPSLTEQAKEVGQWIIIGFVGLPAVSCLLSLVFIRRYPDDRKISHVSLAQSLPNEERRQAAGPL
ncbi:MFS transporter [Pantoea sp. Tr-811]|uniref:MFS transporter n=1 Tax=Pantoea sp. Tr-811 TaxID=2608361 RepID=UPI00142166AA|nr:MFS transporter [Pantoea sp. Tr-811]